MAIRVGNIRVLAEILLFKAFTRPALRFFKKTSSIFLKFLYIKLYYDFKPTLDETFSLITRDFFARITPSKPSVYRDRNGAVKAPVLLYVYHFTSSIYWSISCPSSNIASTLFLFKLTDITSILTNLSTLEIWNKLANISFHDLAALKNIHLAGSIKELVLCSFTEISSHIGQNLLSITSFEVAYLVYLLYSHAKKANGYVEEDKKRFTQRITNELKEELEPITIVPTLTRPPKKNIPRKGPKIVSFFREKKKLGDTPSKRSVAPIKMRPSAILV